MLRCRNIGKFKVSNLIIDECIVQGNHIKESELFSGMVVLDVKTELETDHKWYVALHPSFREIMFGTLIPEYVGNVDSLTGKITWIEKPFREQGYALLPSQEEA